MLSLFIASQGKAECYQKNEIVIYRWYLALKSVSSIGLWCHTPASSGALSRCWLLTRASCLTIFLPQGRKPTGKRMWGFFSLFENCVSFANREITRNRLNICIPLLLKLCVPIIFRKICAYLNCPCHDLEKRKYMPQKWRWAQSVIKGWVFCEK